MTHHHSLHPPLVTPAAGQVGVAELRGRCADHLQAHASDLLLYLTEPGSGDRLSDSEGGRGVSACVSAAPLPQASLLTTVSRFAALLPGVVKSRQAFSPPSHFLTLCMRPFTIPLPHSAQLLALSQVLLVAIAVHQARCPVQLIGGPDTTDTLHLS